MITDSHCHLNMLDPQIYGDTQAVLAQAEKAGVTRMLNVSVSMETFPQVLATAKAHESVFASVGVHPCYQEARAPSVEELVRWVNQEPKVIAMGEMGFDFYHQTESQARAWQEPRFVTQIEAAIQAQVPVIIHTRQSIEATLSVLKAHSADQCGGVMHCFVESWAFAQQALDLGFYISLSGIVSFKNAHQVHEVARKIPLDRLLVETDAPYLAPVPHRGKPNWPGYTRHVVECIAQLRGQDWQAIAQQTHHNFEQLFPRHRA
jgi:TatD DNase family protein